MPKLANQFIHYSAPDGTVFRAEVQCWVDSKGTFGLEIPPELSETARHLFRFGGVAGAYRGPETDLQQINIDWAKNRLTGRQLNAVVRAMHILARMALECEVITERVIVYRGEVNAPCWVDENGELHPDGVRRGGHWWKSQLPEPPSSNFNKGPEVFSIGFAAVVMDRTIYKRTTGDTVKWNRVRDTPGAVAALNDWHTNITPESEGVRVIPYSDAAALYFAETLKKICAMAIGLDKFLGDPEAVQAAIANQQLLLQ